MADRTGDVSEAMWELGKRYGVGLSVGDQVAIARGLAGIPPVRLTADAVRQTFQRERLAPPPRRYAAELAELLSAVAPRANLITVLLDYRAFAVRELSSQFGGKVTAREDELRNNLLTFLPERGYAEARTGRGRTDILFPSPKVIIEVKVWASPRVYQDGLIELERYIETEDAQEAYMVIFSDRVPLPPLVSDHRKAIAEERTLADVVVPVVMILFEVDQPSKAGMNQRRRTRAGR